MKKVNRSGYNQPADRSYWNHLNRAIDDIAYREGHHNTSSLLQLKHMAASATPEKLKELDKTRQEIMDIAARRRHAVVDGALSIQLGAGTPSQKRNKMAKFLKNGQYLLVTRIGHDKP